MLKTTEAQRKAAKAYYQRNREIVLEKSRAARAEKGSPPRKILTPEEKSEAARARAKAFYQGNRREILMRQHFPQQLNRIIAESIRKGIRKAILNPSTRGRTAKVVVALKISVEEFRAYIAGKFLAGMTLDNYGEWELDHIKSLSKFDLSDDEQYAEACHYSNYQPLWKLDNQKKGAR